MQIRKPAGQHAGAVKYDVLSALLVLAAQGGSVEARLALRLSLLITTRYNWRSGTFCVGQREIARMWGVTERTAKREMSAMRTLGWVTVSRPAARGRVAEHRIDLAQVLIATKSFWADIGPDFVARMDAPAQAAGETPQSNVVQLRPAPAPLRDGSLWSAVAEQLLQDHPATYTAWFAQLVQVDLQDGILVLGAKSGFVADYVQQHLVHRLTAAAISRDPSVKLVQVRAVPA
ncbi:DnaA N-terminal domain-containing protein [Loktanella salsilacus]|jgi:hypothetical protein|uniref:DnaA N-terminal domain-containing protein n=1 Tax=Loktanella salsilacus TaxID=195913 RepID=UPI0020B80EEE|nr:DnaA N-terminal domain-containing protein [Loktanella salsilacus]UTH46620.1 hypothetical protein KBK07_17065 [Loktanella salsilacus]